MHEFGVIMDRLILKHDQLINYENDLYNNNGLISYCTGELLDIPENTKYIVPGYIDRHTHGGYGIDYMDANVDGNEVLLRRLAEEGITTVVPTTMTMSYEAIINASNAIEQYSGDGINCHKIHLEGPFLNREKVGAQNPKFLAPVDSKLVEKIKSNVSLISYAPELDSDNSFLKYLQENNIEGSIVHSNASYEQVKCAYDAGLKSFSHFYNGSSFFSHRDPGAVNSGLGLDNTKLELICDGIHVHPFVVKSTYKLKGNDNIMLITDSIRAKGLEDGEYDLGGQRVFLKEGAVRLESGMLAGSVLKMDVAVKNYYQFTGCSIAEAINAASKNVAKSLNINSGELTPGKRFDVLCLDEDLNVLATYANGNLLYKK